MKPVLMEQLLRSYLKHRFPPGTPQGKQQAQSLDEVDGPLLRECVFAEETCNQINWIAARLVKMADDFQKNYEIHRGGRRQSEIQESEDSENSMLSMTNVAHSLSTSLNPENFKTALHSVCQHATSLPLEAALALELTAHVYRVIDFRNCDFIPNAVAQYFGSRIKMEDLEKIDS